MAKWVWSTRCINAAIGLRVRIESRPDRLAEFQPNKGFVRKNNVTRHRGTTLIFMNINTIDMFLDPLTLLVDDADHFDGPSKGEVINSQPGFECFRGFVHDLEDLFLGHGFIRWRAELQGSTSSQADGWNILKLHAPLENSPDGDDGMVDGLGFHPSLEVGFLERVKMDNPDFVGVSGSVGFEEPVHAFAVILIQFNPTLCVLVIEESVDQIGTRQGLNDWSIACYFFAIIPAGPLAERLGVLLNGLCMITTKVVVLIAPLGHPPTVFVLPKCGCSSGHEGHKDTIMGSNVKRRVPKTAFLTSPSRIRTYNLAVNSLYSFTWNRSIQERPWGFVTGMDT